MKKQFDFIKALFNHFEEDCSTHISRMEKLAKCQKYSSEYWENVLDRNCGKGALKRKIVMLRQELLNLSKEIDKE